MIKFFLHYRKYIGNKSALQYLFFQRILRINSNIPWPTHWSSIVTSANQITKKDYTVPPYPGYMPGCYIQAINGIQIGEGCRMGPGIKLISANHNLYDYSKHDKADSIIISDYCWLGANCVILPGVLLGKHTVVAAGAVVTESFPEGNQVLGGVPARVIKKLEEYHEA